jgi:hypothetical protein
MNRAEHDLNSARAELGRVREETGTADAPPARAAAGQGSRLRRRADPSGRTWPPLGTNVLITPTQGPLTAQAKAGNSTRELFPDWGRGRLHLVEGKMNALFVYKLGTSRIFRTGCLQRKIFVTVAN